MVSWSQESKYFINTQPIDFFLSKDAERFHTDVSGEYKQTRDREVQRRQEIQDSKRKENLNREEARWEKIDQENQKEEEKWKNLAGTSMRNNSSVPYDLLNLRFNNGKDAQRGQYIQDSIDVCCFNPKQNKTKQNLNQSSNQTKPVSRSSASTILVQ